MATIIQTSALTPERIDELPKSHVLWIYNGLDCCLTTEISAVLQTKLEGNKEARTIYRFERALQAPALELMLRGFAVDMEWRHILLGRLEQRATSLDLLVDRYAQVVWDKGLNSASPKQMVEFFYGVLGLPEQYKKVKGVKKVACGREQLEALQSYFVAKPFIHAILRSRELWKMWGTLKSGIDADNRMRSSYNIAGTDTGRWSSSKNAFGTGTNGQNITQDLRRAFIASPGKKMGGFDLEQAESRLVGLLAWLSVGKDTYLNACSSGDLHTTVCQMVWSELPWTGDQKKDKKNLAEQPFYRQFTYRDMAKRGGHGTNYFGKPWTMARHLKVETRVMEDFQHKYFHAFPEIPQWHQYTATTLQTKGQLTTPLGRKRFFFGRLGDDNTLRPAIAFVPQGTIGDYMNYGIYLCWKDRELRSWGFRMLAQVHDALYFEYDPDKEEKVVERVKSHLSHIVYFKGRPFSIPCEAKIGWNWGNMVTEEDVARAQDKGETKELNIHGLKKYDPTKPDTRTAPTYRTTTQSLLDRIIR